MSSEQINMDAYTTAFFDGDGCIKATIRFKRKVPYISPAIEITQSYIGGLIDSEGCLTFSIKPPTEITGPTIQPIFKMTLVSKDEHVLDLIQKHLQTKAIKSTIYHTKREPPWENISTLSINSWHNVKRFLERIYPYSIIKKAQIKIMLEEIMPKINPYRTGSRIKYSKKKFIEIMGSIDKMNALKGGRLSKQQPKYTEQYFRDLWNIWD